MKKVIFIFLATISMATIQSCQTAKTATGSKMLKFNFEKGKGYDYEMIINMDQDRGGQISQTDMSAYYSLYVTDDDGTTKTITNTFERVVMNVGMAGMNLVVDSDKPIPETSDKNEKEDPIKMLNKIFGAIKGKKFNMKVNTEGKVMEVRGLSDIAASIVGTMNIDEKVKQLMIQQFSKQFNEQSVKEQFERVLYIFPNKEVKVGDSWQKTTSPGGPMGGNYNSTYTVKDIEGDMVTLDEKSTIDGSGDQTKMSGEITGTIIVDSKTGLVVNADQDINLSSTAEGKTMKIKGKTKLKGKAR